MQWRDSSLASLELYLWFLAECERQGRSYIFHQVGVKGHLWHHLFCPQTRCRLRYRGHADVKSNLLVPTFILFPYSYLCNWNWIKCNGVLFVYVICSGSTWSFASNWIIIGTCASSSSICGLRNSNLRDILPTKRFNLLQEKKFFQSQLFCVGPSRFFSLWNWRVGVGQGSLLLLLLLIATSWMLPSAIRPGFQYLSDMFFQLLPVK